MRFLKQTNVNDKDFNKIIENINLECDLSDGNRIQLYNYLVCTWTLSHLAKQSKFVSISFMN